jgi:hypothetical protein
MSRGALAFLADAYDVGVNFREVRLSEIYEMAPHLVRQPRRAEFLLVLPSSTHANSLFWPSL